MIQHPIRSYWRRRSHEAIQQAIDEAKRQGLSGTDLEAFVRANGYPFGLRENYPYKVWCSEVKAMLLDRPHQPKPRKGHDELLPLFTKEDPC